MEEQKLDRLPICLKQRKMETDFDLNEERECFSCFYDLHLSAVSCKCTPDRFSCLRHVNLLCSCDVDNKCVLFRYTINELNTLVEALEGKAEALKVWISEQDRSVVPVDKMVVSVGKQDIEEKLNIDVSCNLNGNGSPKVVQSGVKQENFSPSTSHITMDGHSDSAETPIVKGNKVGPECFIDLNIDCMSDELESRFMCLSDSCDNKPVINVDETCKVTSDDGKVCGSDVGREQNAMELDSSCHSSRRDVLPNKDYPICFGEMENNHASDCNKLFRVQIPSTSTHSEVSVAKAKSSDTLGQKIYITDHRASPSKLDHRIELMYLGSVIFGKRWCSKQAIFPKGTYT